MPFQIKLTKGTEMFEHKNLDGVWNRVVSSTDAFLNGDILECRDTVGSEPEKISRLQYAVVGQRLVERCLPPEALSETWSHDAGKLPWWDSVKNPPHMGIIADFNSHSGGEHRIPFDANHNVVGYANEGEEIVLAKGMYTVSRKSDGKELSAPSMLQLRELYFA
ncbi:hypothetical protein Metme_2747 [Methylomonas methanica MC09]|uniref:Uncharacterized protein n=2 Tax=Methylomonas methanica TaxID=421 RepID=F9ZZA3_METMM|nr:hypothetical protein Metme_2747 [Methylomonas methanica MC09]